MSASSLPSASSQSARHTNHISADTVDLVRRFSTERDWDQFHSPENLAKSICIEAAELLECYQWTPGFPAASQEHVEEELADVLNYCIQLSDRLGVDMDEIVRRKLAKTEKKYPVAVVKDDPAAAQKQHDDFRRRENEEKSDIPE